MSDHESVCYTDLIAGSYLWAGSPADILSHSGLCNKQEEIRQGPGNIARGSL